MKRIWPVLAALCLLLGLPGCGAAPQAGVAPEAEAAGLSGGEDLTETEKNPYTADTPIETVAADPVSIRISICSSRWMMGI